MGIDTQIYLGSGVLVYENLMTAQEQAEWKQLLDDLEKLGEEAKSRESLRGMYDGYEDEPHVTLFGFRDEARANIDRTPNGPMSYSPLGQKTGGSSLHTVNMRPPSSATVVKLNRKKKAQPKKWKKWSEEAEAAGYDYYGNTSVGTVPSMFVDLAMDLPDADRVQIVREVVDHVRHELRDLDDDKAHEHVLKAFEAVLLNPRWSLPSRWLAYYYT
jgi:hypothetical protein